jgi:hypothetical protein
MRQTAVFWILEPGSCAGHERNSCFLEKQLPVDDPTSSPTEMFFSAQSFHGFKIQLTYGDMVDGPSSCAGHVTPGTTADHAVL